MGRLTYLELENFKSYAGKHLVGPFSDFSCIVGPNGAGKSNMMDAISFVLGVQSRQLRSANLKELIYSSEEAYSSPRSACVRLFFELLADEVDVGQKNTVVFSRSISIAGISSYRIDGKEVTGERYDSQLQRFGVLVKARNFLVFQGDVESIASKTPSELSKLIEHISGSDQFADEYSALFSRKNDAEESAIFMMQKKKLFLSQRKEIKEQKDEAEEFQGKVQLLSDLKAKNVLLKMWKLKLAISSCESASETFRSGIVECAAKDKKIEEKVSNEKKALAKLSKKVEVADKDLIEKRAELEALLLDLNKLNAQLKIFGKRSVEIDRALELISSDQNARHICIRDLEEEISRIDHKGVEVSNQIKLLKDSGISVESSRMEEYSQLRALVATKVSNQLSEVNGLEFRIRGKQQLYDRITDQLEELDNEILKERQAIEEVTTRADRLNSQILVSKDELNRISQDRDLVLDSMTEAHRSEKELESELSQIVASLTDAGEDKRRGKQEEKIVNALTSMKRIFPGVHGKLDELCSPVNKKYSTAIAVAAGRHMDAIVVDSKRTASDCIEYLRDQKIGTCMFLPLDNLVLNPIPDRLRNLGERFRPCIDLVVSEDCYKPALSYALGTAIVCENLEDAQDICFVRQENVKVVTLKGHIISKSGAMTGGSSARESHDRWEDRNLDALRQRKSVVEELLSKIRQGSAKARLTEIDSKQKSIQTQIQFSSADLEILSRKLVEQQRQLESKFCIQRTLRSQQSELKTTLNDMREMENAIKSNMKEVEAEVFRKFSASIGIENIREYEINQIHSLESLLSQKSELAQRHAELISQLEFQTKRDFEFAFERSMRQKNDIDRDIADLTQSKDKILVRENNIRLSIENLRNSLVKAQQAKSAGLEVLKGLQCERQGNLAEKESLEKKLSSEQMVLERFTTQLNDILHQALMDEVSLPVKVPTDLSTDSSLKWSGPQSNLSGLEAR